jgi:hypothetical protein
LRPLFSVNSSVKSRTSRRFFDSFARAGMSISTLKWPELQMIAPSFIARKCSSRRTPLLPVTVMKTSPSRAAFDIGITRNPSMAASSALVGSISVTMTFAPMPRLRIATPLPHQP